MCLHVQTKIKSRLHPRREFKGALSGAQTSFQAPAAHCHVASPKSCNPFTPTCGFAVRAAPTSPSSPLRSRCLHVRLQPGSFLLCRVFLGLRSTPDTRALPCLWRARPHADRARATQGSASGMRGDAARAVGHEAKRGCTSRG